MSFAERSREESPVLTIGYGALGLEEFAARLSAHSVEYLIDVRTSPYSRYRPEYNREQLERVFRDRPRYVFMGDLLGARVRDEEVLTGKGRVNYLRLADEPAFQRGLERVLTARANGLRVALMCSEGRPEQCHRTKLIGATLAERGVEVRHIDERGLVVSQAEVVDRLTGGQLGLFAEVGDGEFSRPAELLTSRKPYRARPGGSS